MNNETIIITGPPIIDWSPTMSLRWKRVMIDEVSYKKVLQQKWISGSGEEKWEDIPEEKNF